MKVCNQIKKGIVLAAALLVSALAAEAFQPQETVVPLLPILSTGTNTTVITNTASSFKPFVGLDQRLVITGTGAGISSSNITVGFDQAFDPAGANFTTSIPLLCTTAIPTNYGTSWTAVIYLNATNFTGVTAMRQSEFATTALTNETITSIKFEANY